MLIAERAEISAFVDSIFRYADPGTFISLRAFDQKDRGKPPVLIQGVPVGDNPDDLINAAAAAAQRAANAPSPAVFAPPVATFRNAQSARYIDLANGVAISVELDSGDTRSAKARLEHLLGPCTTVMASGGQWIDPETGEVHDKLHLHWRLSEPTRTSDDHERLRLARQLAAQLVGGDPTAAPPVHPLRWPGSWNLKGKPRLAMIAGGNPAAEVHLIDALDRLQEAVELAGIAAQVGPHISGAQPTSDLARVAAAMAAIPNDDVHWDQWTRFGMALYRASGGSEAGLAIWRDWSAKSAKHEDGACQERWAHFATSPPTMIGAGTVFFHANQAGWTWQSEPPPDPDDPGYRASLEAHADATADRWAPEADAPHVAAGAPVGKTDDKPPLIIRDDSWDEATLPRRPWIARGYLMRRAVTTLAGIGSGGKSGLTLAWGIALALQRPWSRMKPLQPCRVGIYNAEDDDDEQKLRLSAALRQFAAEPADLVGRLYRLGPQNVGTLIERDQVMRTLRFTPAMGQMIEWLEATRPDVLILDPLIALHNADENDNTAIRSIMATFRALAVRFDMAIMLAHHVRKGSQSSPGDMETLRGGSDIAGASRAVLTLTVMTEEEADSLQVQKDNRRSFFRVDGAKQNYTAIQNAEWFQRFEYELDNGEVVAAVEPWSPPSTAPTVDIVLAALDGIRKGSPHGPWSYKLTDDPRSFRALAVRLGVSTKAAQAELRDTLIRTQGVVVSKYRVPRRTLEQAPVGMRTADFEPSVDWIDRP